MSSHHFLIKRLGFFEKRHPPYPFLGEGQRFVFAGSREIPRARRIFRAKKRRGVIIPCIAADSFDTHAHRERAVSIYARERETEEEFWIERYVFVEREREREKSVYIRRCAGPSRIPSGARRRGRVTRRRERPRRSTSASRSA